MKPNEQELEAVKDILGGVCKYRETYEEIYDHVLSALDAVPDDVTFVDAFYNIIEHDLGGKPGIGRIETKYKKAAIKEIIIKYLKYFGIYLLSPYVLAAFALTGVLYWFLKDLSYPTFTVTACFAVNVILSRLRERWFNKEIANGVFNKNSVSKLVYPYLMMLPIILSASLGLIYLSLHSFGMRYLEVRLQLDWLFSLLTLLTYWLVTGYARMNLK